MKTVKLDYDAVLEMRVYRNHLEDENIRGRIQKDRLVELKRELYEDGYYEYLTEINVPVIPDLCQRVEAAVKADRKRFSMDTWCGIEELGYVTELADTFEKIKDARHTCGTVMCHAGWVVHCALDALRGGNIRGLERTAVPEVSDMLLVASGVPYEKLPNYSCSVKKSYAMRVIKALADDERKRNAKA